MAFFQRLIVLLTILNLTFAAPLTPRQDSQCVNGVAQIFMPEMHNIYLYKGVPQFPSRGTILNVMNGSSSQSVQEQVARWSIPSTATNCEFGWSQAAERSFSVYNNGLINFQQMTGLPSSNVTAETIQPFLDPAGPSGSIDATLWPELPEAHSHLGGNVNCAANVVIHLSKNIVEGGAGSITLEQDARNGLWLRYNC